MDFIEPVPPASSFAQRPAPAATPGPGACVGTIACGSGPDWALVDAGDTLSLRIAGAPAIAALGGRWAMTPRGRRLTATTAQGDMVLEITHGLCRPDGPAGVGGREGSGFARLTLPDGRQLHGCMMAAGPYPGNAYPAYPGR